MFASKIVSSLRIVAPRANLFKPMMVRGFASDTFLDVGDVTSRILTVVSSYDKITDKSKITPLSRFALDLGLDSLDAVEVVMSIEDEFAIEIPDAEADKILSIEDAVKYVSSHPQAK